MSFLAQMGRYFSKKSGYEKKVRNLAGFLVFLFVFSAV